MVVSPYGGSDGGGGITGGGDLRLLTPEYSHTVHCDHAHYGPVSGVGAEVGFKGGHVVVGAGRIGLGGDADGDYRGGTDGGGRGDRRNGDRYGLNWWGG